MRNQHIEIRALVQLCGAFVVGEEKLSYEDLTQLDDILGNKHVELEDVVQLCRALVKPANESRDELLELGIR